MTRWRYNVYRVPPRTDGEATGDAAGDALSDAGDDSSERDWRFADAVYEDVM